MITDSQIRYWLKHRHLIGVADRLDPQRDPLTYEEWTTIEEMAARVGVIGRGLASPEFERENEALLVQQFTPEAIKSLREGAKVG